LSVARIPKFIGIGVEEKASDVAPGYLGRLVDELPALVIDPRSTHARPL
jgi:hypothetical protein